MEQEILQKIQVIAQRKYPGRAISDLSEEEKKALFADYQSEKGLAADMINTPMPQGQRVGPSGIYVNNPWDALGAAAQRMAGGYMLGKTRKREAQGREAAADLQTRRDALDRQADISRSREEEERRQQWMSAILTR